MTTTISAKNEESIVILINDSKEQAFIYAGSTDRDKKRRKVWFSNEPIKPDDVVDIKVIESDGMKESAIMTGFILKLNGEVFAGAMDGCSTITITGKNDTFRLEFGGMDKLAHSCVWCTKTLEAGDRLSIKYTDIDKSEISAFAEFVDVVDEFKLLESYHRMKQELMDEGLI